MEKVEILRALGVNLPDAYDEVSDEQINYYNYLYHTWLREADSLGVWNEPRWICDIYEIGREIESLARLEILERNKT